jgi:hydrogenase-4 component H
MFKLLKEIFRTGEATVKYPFAPLEVSKDFRGKPEHDAKQCIACAACAIACPPNAIGIETDVEAATRTWSISYGRCIFCGRCEEVCPTGAIRLSAAFELAVTRKEDLEHSAVFTLAPCACCGKPFAPAKEVAYVIELLAMSSGTSAATERSRLLVATCPECKRRHDVEQLMSLSVAQQMEAGR